MTLDGNDKAVLGLDALDGAVLAFGGLVEPGSQPADCLVVKAVDADLVLAGGMAELGARIHLDRVRQVAAPVAAYVVVVEVLDERATKGDVDDLLPAADAEDGEILLARQLEKA